METTTSYSPMRVAAKWGAITGLVTIIVFMIRYMAIGSAIMENSWMQWVLSLAILFTCLFLGVKEQRDQVQDGYIDYGKGLGTAMLICLFLGIISGFFNYMFFKFGDPTLIEQSLQIAEDRMREKNMPDEQIEMALEMTKKFMTPVSMAITSVFAQLLTGLIPALIIAAIVKKQKTEPGF